MSFGTCGFDPHLRHGAQALYWCGSGPIAAAGCEPDHDVEERGSPAALHELNALEHTGRRPPIGVVQTDDGARRRYAGSGVDETKPSETAVERVQEEAKRPGVEVDVAPPQKGMGTLVFSKTRTSEERGTR